MPSLASFPAERKNFKACEAILTQNPALRLITFLSCKHCTSEYVAKTKIFEMRGLQTGKTANRGPCGLWPQGCVGTDAFVRPAAQVCRAAGFSFYPIPAKRTDPNSHEA